MSVFSPVQFSGGYANISSVGSKLTVGPGVGNIVGSSVGAVVGAWLVVGWAEKDGDALGFDDGAIDGILLGALLGIGVASAPGSILGVEGKKSPTSRQRRVLISYLRLCLC
mmetsp:Transcript_7115/g.14887  ORF Transcript_7115/g.14887 Transcript_7115/m.14887 type:complete len:111 (-) Transcript_7115:43-375(-)